MKLQLNKKKLKNLTKDNHLLPILPMEATTHIGGGHNKAQDAIGDLRSTYTCKPLTLCDCRCA